SVVSLQLAADPMKGLGIVEIEVVEKPRPQLAAEEPKGKGGPPPAKKDEPSSAPKELLTPEVAIKRRGQEKVTVQFQVAAVKMGWNSGRIPKGAKTSQSWFQLDDGNDFSVVLKGGPTYRLEQLGIDAIRHFEGKVVRATGRVLGDKPPFSIGVDDLDQFQVVLEPFVKGKGQPAPEKDQPAAEKVQPASAQKPSILTSEQAIKQRPKEPVTVQFKIAEVHAAPSPGTGFGQDVILLKDAGKFSARIEEPARVMILRLGIEPEKYFLGKVIWITGLVEPVPGTDAEPSFHIRVKDLMQLNVVREQQPAPPADPKESRQKPASVDKFAEKLFEEP
ncbi:MAG TPA: hypothetical protein VFW62_01015, partial [bacterium]|nr:hypothetical protein [bacterium]